MEEKIIYFKIYESIDCCGDGWTYYVEAYETTIALINHWAVSHLESGELMPVIEPVMMTESEFKKLPEFEGF